MSQEAEPIAQSVEAVASLESFFVRGSEEHEVVDAG
jgi:hypothetical protein